MGCPLRVARGLLELRFGGCRGMGCLLCCVLLGAVRPRPRVVGRVPLGVGLSGVGPHKAPVGVGAVGSWVR